MIRISLLGIDRYIVGAYAKDATKKIAKLYGVKEEEIVFYAPESYLYFKGVEQSSYQVVVEVYAPNEYKKFQKEMADFLLASVSKFVIHVAIRFAYFDKTDFYQKINPDFMRYLDDTQNEVEEDEIMKEGIEDEELFEGNAFEGFDEEYRKGHPNIDDEGECGDECHCEDNCQCNDDGGCTCNHHHEK